jgi:hypothetical protein
MPDLALDAATSGPCRWCLSTKITSPMPITRLSPSLAVIFTPASRLTMYCRARGGMPIDIVLGLGLAEDDTGGRQALSELAASPILYPFHFDVAEMRLAAGISIQIVYAHRSPSSKIPAKPPVGARAWSSFLN